MKRRAFIAGLMALPFAGKAAAKTLVPVCDEVLLVCDVELYQKFNKNFSRWEFEMRWDEKRAGKGWVRRTRSWFQYNGSVDLPIAGLPKMRVTVDGQKVTKEWYV